jgi:hypothetical protein
MILDNMVLNLILILPSAYLKTINEGPLKTPVH